MWKLQKHIGTFNANYERVRECWIICEEGILDIEKKRIFLCFASLKYLAITSYMVRETWRFYPKVVTTWERRGKETDPKLFPTYERYGTSIEPKIIVTCERRGKFIDPKMITTYKTRGKSIDPKTMTCERRGKSTN